MHHPGPPRFLAVGDGIELAPRDPDPTESYAWNVQAVPAGSTAAVGDDAVEQFAPDVPGRYRIELTAPDGTHELTVRAFPGRFSDAEAAEANGRSGTHTGTEATTPAAGETTPSAREDEETAPDVTGPGGRPRVRLSARRTAGSVVVRAAAHPHPDGPETTADLTVEFLIDDRDSLARADVCIEQGELSIPLEHLPERARIHAVSVGRHGYSVPDALDITRSQSHRERSGSRAGGTGPTERLGAGRTIGSGRPLSPEDEQSTTGDTLRVRRPYDPPEWAEDAFIYEIYVRTFPGQHADAGRSAFDAIVDRLDYLDGLGVDTLWLTPVLENDHAPHGYNVTDFFTIAADLGTRGDYERFVDAAHDRGMRVLFDLVCNHTARDHPHFQAAVADPDSEYRDWYEWRGPTEPETYFDWEHIANLDFAHLPVRRHLLDAVEEWAPLVDGFRCDMAWAVPNSFWREIHDRLKSRREGFLLLTETIPYIPDYQAGLFDVHFDSTTYAALRRVGHGEDAEAILDAVGERTEIGFPDHAGFMLYAENHDEERYLRECGRPAAKAALGALFTLPGAPMVYAGQEFGQRGRRDDLAWTHADGDLREHVAALAAVRASQPQLAAGADLRRVSYEVRDGDAGAVVAFARVADGEPGERSEAAVVVLNFGARPATVVVGPETGSTDLSTGESVAPDGAIRVTDVAVLSADPETV